MAICWDPNCCDDAISSVCYPYPHLCLCKTFCCLYNDSYRWLICVHTSFCWLNIYLLLVASISVSIVFDTCCRSLLYIFCLLATFPFQSLLTACSFVASHFMVVECSTSTFGIPIYFLVTSYVLIELYIYIFFFFLDFLLSMVGFMSHELLGEPQGLQRGWRCAAGRSVPSILRRRLCRAVPRWSGGGLGQCGLWRARASGWAEHGWKWEFRPWRPCLLIFFGFWVTKGAILFKQ